MNTKKLVTLFVHCTLDLDLRRRLFRRGCGKLHGGHPGVARQPGARRACAHLHQSQPRIRRCALPCGLVAHLRSGFHLGHARLGGFQRLGATMETQTAPADHHAPLASPGAPSGEDLHRQVSWAVGRNHQN